jgi:hypothetical protein
MPFLQFADRGPIPLTSRGSLGCDEEFWEPLNEIQRVLRLAGLTNIRLTTQLLGVQKCPGLWRTYYTAKRAATGGPAHPRAGVTGTCLGRAAPRGGTDVEDWVHDANRLTNASLEDPAAASQRLAAISTPALRSHYTPRVEALIARELPENLLRLRMQVPAKIQLWPGLPLHDSTPDGLFEDGRTGAVFESKLTDPRENIEFLTRFAAYTLSAEKKYNHPFGDGILLHCGPDGQTPELAEVPVLEMDAQRVKASLELLRRLVRDSWARWKQRAPRGGKPATWRALLGDRPSGRRPPPNQLGQCPGCEFKDTCWQEGGWN